MRTKEIKLYTFDELSEEAKEKAINTHRDWNVDYYWWDFVYDDAKDIASIIGIDIDNIWFSGFWSQGDGACFVGTYRYVPGSVKKIKDHAPHDTELHSIAKNLQITQSKAQYQLYASVRKNHFRHEHENSVDVSIDHGWDYEFDESIARDLIDSLRDFMRWIYRRLEDEHRYLTSDEVVAETLVSNEVEFDENGNVA